MRTLVTICLLIGFQFTRGQSTKPSITGKVMDSLSGTELAFATASIYRAKDTSLIAFKLSNLSGSFKVAGLPLNINLRVIITYSGYREFRKEFMLTNNKLEYDLGTIILSRDIRSLDEILVIAERPPIVVRKDTIEFNANSFKTLPSALLEDLLKKLPGVELGRDGNITVNGKHVNRILVDGKDFFAGDISIATRNLPANIIDKIQVVNDGEEVERNPDAPEGSIGKVINVKLKKSIKKGWFGKIYAGKGTGGRYELGGIVNSFADTLQVSVLGFGNNINKAGFGLGDLQSIGGFSRSGMRAAKMIDNGVQVNGVSLGGIGQGIQESNGAGVNLNHDIGKKLTLNVQYFYGQLKSTVNESNFLEQRFANSFLITESLQSNLINDKIHKLSSTFKWKPTPTINITYRPSFSWQKNVLAVHRTANSGNNLYPLLNNLVNTLSIQDINKSINQEIVVNKNFRKRGRSLMVGFNFTSNNTESDAYNKSETIFFDVTPSYTDTIDQLRSRDNEKTVYNLSMNYAEPISKKIIVRISNLFETSNYIDGILTLKKPDPSGSYTMIDTAFSNKLGRNGWKNIMSTTVSFNTGAIKISPGIGYTFLHFNNRLGKSDFLKQNYSYIIPRIAITWKQLTISYQSTVIEPSGNDLIPVPDNNNPLLFRFGNINLTPVLSNLVYFDYQYFNNKNATNFFVYLTGGTESDGIIYSRYTDSSGVQSAYPANVDGVWNTGASISFGKLIRQKNNVQISLRAIFNPNYYNSLILVNKIQSTLRNFSMSPSFSFSFNYKDFFEINEKYIFGLSSSKYGNLNFRNQRITQHVFQSELIIRLPKHFVWETTFENIYNPLLQIDGTKSIIRWNAALNYLFLKDEKAQLRIHVFDILNRNSAINRIVKENYLSESTVNVLNRYVMATFSYNIRNLRPRKVGGKNSLLFY